jgi:hypothetical protein
MTRDDLDRYAGRSAMVMLAHGHTIEGMFRLLHSENVRMECTDLEGHVSIWTFDVRSIVAIGSANLGEPSADV